MTTGRLMILVALVTVALWAVMYLPETLDEHFENRHRAAAEAAREDEAKDAHRQLLIQARQFHDDLDRWRRRANVRNPRTERYLTAREAVALAEAQYQFDSAAYHSALQRHYRRAIWMPWLSEPRNLKPPRDPFLDPGQVHEPGKFYQTELDGVTTIAFSPATAIAALERQDHTIRLLDPQTGDERAILTLAGRWPYDIAFSPDGKTLAAAGFKTPVQLLDMSTRHKLRTFTGSENLAPPPYGTWDVTRFAFAPDGQSLIVVLGGLAAKPITGRPFRGISVVRRFDTESGAIVWEHEGAGGGTSGVACSPDGETVALADGAVTLVNLRTGLTKTTLKPAAGYVFDVAYSPDGRTLAGAGSNTVPQGEYGGQGRVTLWDTTSGAILHALSGPTGRGQKVAFSPDGRFLATAGYGPKGNERRRSVGVLKSPNLSEVKLFDSATGAARWTVNGDAGAASSLSFSPDGKTLGFCDANYCYLIDAQTGELIDILAETTSTVRVHEHPSATGKSRPGSR